MARGGGVDKASFCYLDCPYLIVKEVKFARPVVDEIT